MRTSMPLRSSAKKHSVVIQCVIRTVAKRRGTALEAVAVAAASQTRAESGISRMIPFRPANCAPLVLLLRSGTQGHNRPRGRQSDGPDNPESTRKRAAVAPHALAAGIALFQKDQGFEF